MTSLVPIIYALFKALLDAWVENAQKPTVAIESTPVPATLLKRFADQMRRLKGGIY